MDDALHILIVEDSPTDRKLVEVYLAKSDLVCELAHAQDMLEPLAHLQDKPTDAILMDLHLPDSFGLQTFLDVHSKYPETPVVILSGDSDDETALGAVRQGAQDYLPKSEFSSSTLARSIRYAVERHERNILRRQLADHEEDLQSAARPESVASTTTTGRTRFRHCRCLQTCQCGWRRPVRLSEAQPFTLGFRGGRCEQSWSGSSLDHGVNASRSALTPAIPFRTR